MNNDDKDNDDDILPFLKKQDKKPNYKERVRLGLQKGGLKPISEKQKQRLELEKKEHNKNIANGVVYCVKCGSTNHVEKHHYKGRAYPNEFVYLCGEFGCGFHKWIHLNENEAFKLGWLWPEYRGLPHDEKQKIPWKKQATW